jgi:hypothetical protein
MAERLMDPVVARALVVIEAVTQTIADLESRPDASDWSEQVEALSTLRRDLMNEIGITPTGDYLRLLKEPEGPRNRPAD